MELIVDHGQDKKALCVTSSGKKLTVEEGGVIGGSSI